MTRKIVIVALFGFVALGPVAAAWAQQSLADVAKKEEERRKTIKKPAKVYTNSDLKGVPPATSTATAAADGTRPPDTAAAAPDKPAAEQPATKDAAPGTKKDQKFWSGRMKELQAQLDHDQTYADALQTRINALATDFVSRDDPAQRAVIAQNKQKALDELARLQQSIQNDKKAIADLEEDARKAGVPPGWLR